MARSKLYLLDSEGAGGTFLNRHCWRLPEWAVVHAEDIRADCGGASPSYAAMGWLSAFGHTAYQLKRATPKLSKAACLTVILSGDPDPLANEPAMRAECGPDTLACSPQLSVNYLQPTRRKGGSACARVSRSSAMGSNCQLYLVCRRVHLHQCSCDKHIR